MDRDAVVNQALAVGAEEARETWIRNSHYRDGFRKMMWVVNIQMVIILLLAGFLAFYVKTAENRDRYFAQAHEGGKMQMVGLSYPNMGRSTLETWVVQSSVQIMTFGFNDINERFTVSRAHFTDAGWDSFYKAMTASGFAKSVIESQQLVTAVPVSTPVLLREGLIKGKYSWVFEMQLLVTLRSGSVKRTEAKTLRVVVEQVPTRDNPSGVGIGEWYIY